MRNLLFLIVLFFVPALNAQNNADDIVGYYYSIDPFTEESSQSYIYKVADNTYEGKIVWVKNPELKHREGYVFLKNLTFNPKENEWQNGVMLYPGKKGTYKAYMSLTSEGKLKVRGYWGVSLFGKTLYWTRESVLRE
jgi:uncharacterized protein (DUF2147 family)